MTRETLIRNWKSSDTELKAAGYTQICSVLAGKDSGFVYHNMAAPAERRVAEVMIKNENRIVYKARD